MKMLKYVKMILLMGALGVAVSGCVDSDDPDFQVGLERAYVIQKNDKYGGKQFAFYGTVMAVYGTATSVELKKEYMPVFLNKLSDNFYEVNEKRMMWGPLANINGTYTLLAQDDKGVAAQNSFTLKIDKEMGDLIITEPLKYESGRLTAKWKKVDGATAYGFLLGIGQKEGNTYKFSRINTIYDGQGTTLNGEEVKGLLTPYEVITNKNITIPLGTELIVAVVAAIPSQSGTLYLEGDYYKIVLGQDGITPITTTPILGVD